jgi:hypothetical protein
MYCELFVLPPTAGLGDDTDRARLPADTAQAVGTGAWSTPRGGRTARSRPAPVAPCNTAQSDGSERTTSTAWLGETERQAARPESPVDVEDVAAVVSERPRRFDSIVVSAVAAIAAKPWSSLVHDGEQVRSASVST